MSGGRDTQTETVRAEDLIEAIRVAKGHIARGCRSGRSHNPFVYEVAIDAALDVLASRAAQAERALKRIDFVLTTAYGDNIPRGELCKNHARAIARGALMAASSVSASADRTAET